MFEVRYLDYPGRKVTKYNSKALAKYQVKNAYCYKISLMVDYKKSQPNRREARKIRAQGCFSSKR